MHRPGGLRMAQSPADAIARARVRAAAPTAGAPRRRRPAPGADRCRACSRDARRAAQLGGRARRVARRGYTLDNGQHLVLGAYAEVRRLLARLHERVPAQWRPLAIEPFASHQVDAFALRAHRLPAPFHLLFAILGARGLTRAERVATLRWFVKLRRALSLRSAADRRRADGDGLPRIATI